MKIAHILVLSFVLLLIAFGQSDAQDQLPMKGPAAERIAHYKKIRLMEAVPMNEETSVRFFARYQKHEENIRVIGKERNVLIDQLQELIKSNAQDADLENTIKDIGMSEEKVLEERAKFIEELKDILSSKQIAGYIVFERNFNKNLRELMRDVAKNRWNRK
jgi:Skp family chaperone for outer membrane proteins